MENERKDTANADMARAGYDSGISQNGEGIQSSDSEDDFQQGDTDVVRSEERQPTAEEVNANAEILEHDVEEKAAIIVQETHWSGILPPPDVFAQYPENAQEFILENARESSKNINRLVDRSIENDKAASDRQDRLMTEQRIAFTRAQWLTAAISVVVILSVIVCIVFGQPGVAGILAGSFGSITIARMFVDRH